MKITCIVTLSIFELHAALFYGLATAPLPSYRDSCSGQKYYVVPNFLLSYPPFSHNKKMQVPFRGCSHGTG